MVQRVRGGRLRQQTRMREALPGYAAMETMQGTLARWQLDGTQVRERIYRAASPRERERWHALWLCTQGWTAVQVADALGRDAHTIGEWLESFRRQGPDGMVFQQTGGSPPP
jgi:anti-sigma-K factor RskA